MEVHYKSHGVCSQEMIIQIEDGIVQDLLVIGGCNGNSKGISALVKGVPVKEVIKRLEGIVCGQRQTSCPDQLSKALKETLV